MHVHCRFLALFAPWLVASLATASMASATIATAVSKAPRAPHHRLFERWTTDTVTDGDIYNKWTTVIGFLRTADPSHAISESRPPLSPFLRRSHANELPKQRRLQGGGGYDAIDVQSIEAGFVFGILLLFLILLLLCCCCCVGGCSLWDCVILACLWECCCDTDCDAGASLGQSGFDMM